MNQHCNKMKYKIENRKKLSNFTIRFLLYLLLPCTYISYLFTGTNFHFFRKVLCKDIDNAHTMCDPNYGLTIERCGGEGEAGCGLVALFFTGPYLLFGGAIIALLYIASTVLGVQWLIA